MSELLDRIKQHEGLRLKPYHCTANRLSIGYGRNLQDNGITKEEAEIMLRHDVMNAEDACNQFSWFRAMDKVRQGVVVEMVYQMGLPTFLQFKKTIQALRDQDYDYAADEMLNSKWARQVGQRAITLADIMRG